MLLAHDAQLGLQSVILLKDLQCLVYVSYLRTTVRSLGPPHMVGGMNRLPSAHEKEVLADRDEDPAPSRMAGIKPRLCLRQGSYADS